MQGPKILITGAFSSLNKGDETRVRCIVASIREASPQAELSFWSTQPEIDGPLLRELDVTLVPRYGSVSGAPASKLAKTAALGLGLAKALMGKLLGPFGRGLHPAAVRAANVVLDVSGESITSYYGPLNLARTLLPLVHGLLAGKPVVVYAQSVGPFKDDLLKPIAKAIIRRCSLVLLRDESSLTYMEGLVGSLPQMHFTVDPAFSFVPAEPAKVDAALAGAGVPAEAKLVGLCVSRGSYRHTEVAGVSLADAFENFLQACAGLVEYLVRVENRWVVFVPHATQPSENDAQFFGRIQALMQDKSGFSLIDPVNSPAIMKGVIRRCDLFVSTRMHANIAALSSLVPTLAIAYSRKMTSLMKRMGQTDQVLEMEKVDPARLISHAAAMLQHREEISGSLREPVQAAKADDSRNISLLRALLAQTRF